MALSTLAKEQENFLRYAILIVDYSKEALQDLVELNLKNKHLTFNEFLNQNQHEIYHLCYDSRCCQCQNTPPRRKRIIFPSQLELLFDKYNKLPSHTAIGHNDFCCSYAKVGITSQVLDLSLTRCLLVNCCLDVFWFTCLTSHSQTLEQFLNLNKHTIYHLWKNNQNCCHCPSGFIFPSDSSLIIEHEWKNMFSSQLSPCENHRKRISSGSTSICSVGATPGTATQDINPEIQRFILQKCSHISKAVDFLVEQRNLRFAHVPEAKVSDKDFKVFWTDIETHLLGIACVCGKEKHVKKNLRDLHLKPLSINMLSKYEKLLHKNIEAINTNVTSQHQKTRKKVSYNIRKLEDRIESLETSSIEIKEEVQGLRKLITDRSKRSQLIRETSAEIDNHRKDQAYTEIKAITACVQMLDNSKVLILSGREGSGKSKNSLEILRQMKEKHPEIEVIKLKRLNQFTDITDRDKMTIVLFEDVFGRTRKQFSDDTDVQILDTLYSYINLGNVKVIFVMRNTVKHECQSLLSSHDIFCNNIAYLNLNSKEFGLSLKEKKRILINYCTQNLIPIIYRENFYNSDNNDISIDNIKVSIVDQPDTSCLLSTGNTCKVFNSRAVEDIIRSNPYQGFPQCCRLFTKNKHFTILGALFFKYHSNNLLQEIENMRMEGTNNDVKGLKYVILVYRLLNNGESAFNIDVEAHNKLFKECYNKSYELKLHDIIYLYEELTCKYLIIIHQRLYFQHWALQDSVLISYSKINIKAIIPLLSIDHMVDIVRSQNYMEQEGEIVIKISKPNYHELAARIYSLITSERNLESCERFIESKLITENDVDIVYELIGCINNKIDTLWPWFPHSPDSYIYHYFPIFLLRNIGKLDDNKLIVNHTQNQMLISVTTRDKNINLSVDPNVSLSYAFKSKYKDIIKWLLKLTDHSFIKFRGILNDTIPDRVFEYAKLILENVKHNRIDMTQLFIDVYLKVYFDAKPALDWIMDNVDNSLICYEMWIEKMLCGNHSDLIIHVIEKVNRKWLNITKVIKKCCKKGCSKIVEWALNNTDREAFDVEELINIAIDGYATVSICDYDDCESCIGYIKILELFICQKRVILKRFFLDRLYKVASRNNCYRVIELLFKHGDYLLIKPDEILEDIFQHQEDNYNNVYCSRIIHLIMKYYLQYVNVTKIFEKAFQFGVHDVIEELFLEKLDNISFYLDMNLDQLRHQQLNDEVQCFDTGHGKILMLLLPRINYDSKDLKGVMNDVCHIGHSPAIMWLLKNKRSYRFDMRNVLNSACYRGDVKLVEYLYQKYNEEDFDYKTAMLKACRNRQWETIDVCKWLWKNIDHNIFDMKMALNNASRYSNTKNVKWILTDVDTELYDIDDAVLSASEHGNEDTLQLLLNQSGIHMLDIQSALTLSCRNERSCLGVAKLLYRRANTLDLDMHAVLSEACKYYRIDFIQWIIATCDQNKTVTKTNYGNKNCINSLDKYHVDMDHAVTCILDMNTPEQKRDYVNETKTQLLMLILNKSDPSIIHIYKLLTEACKKDWLEIFHWILGRVDNACLNIGEIINFACRFGSFNIIKWSLRNIDMELVDVDNVMVESCGFGWLECVVLIWKHCDNYKLQAAMNEACTYGRLHIAEWLLQNVHYQLFNIPMLLKETGRNGWIKMFSSLLQHFHFDKSEMHIATIQALENNYLEIAELGITKVGKEGFDFSSLSETAYVGANKEGVVNFLLHNIDPKSIDIATIMTNACLFGWKDIAIFILNNDLGSRCDLSLAFNTACDNGELEIMQLLLDKVDPHIPTAVEKAMHSVAVKGWDEIALLLLDNFEHTRLDTRNALIEACRHGEIDVVQAILRKVNNNLLDVKVALNKACENHMHEELVLWVLDNIDQQKVDLKNVKTQAGRHKWRKVQFSIQDVDNDEVVQEIETDNIIIIE